jgi:hypothetical protein
VRDGYGWVGVSLDPGAASFLAGGTPARYAGLLHPGAPGEDTFSGSIFNAVAESLRRPAPDGIVAVPGASDAVRLIAYGYGPAADHLAAYITQMHPRVRLYDGFLLHDGGRFADPAALIAPVLALWSEAAVMADPAPPSVAPRLARWEIAGAGRVPASDISCRLLGPGGGLRHAVAAGLDRLARWVSGGAAPASAMLQRDGGTIARDRFGNAQGGVRLPFLAAAVASYRATAPEADCRALENQPFDTATLTRLYRDRAGWLAAERRAADRAMRAGWLLGADAQALLAAARDADLRFATPRR